MEKIAKFEKVSFDAFQKAFLGLEVEEAIIKKYYEDLKLPRRATVGSAGYDFFMPYPCSLKSGESILIPTGIRVKIDPGYVLVIAPRSSLGFKARLQLDNTLGIIDSDYYYSDNEGHIFIKLTLDAKTPKEILLKKGDAFVQGMFLPFGITIDDDTVELRNGGMGSTNHEA